jgi:hypothetical protein
MTQPPAGQKTDASRLSLRADQLRIITSEKILAGKSA